jgi:hypothetical protein
VTQLRLFDCENPLRKKLGVEFFRTVPEAPGVYRFLDYKGQILYVGKAKNLRKRLLSYSYLKSSQKSKKVWCLVNQVSTITYETESTELAAVLLENHLLRTLKPTYNRLNTRPEYYSYLVLRVLKNNKKSVELEWNLLNESQFKNFYKKGDEVFGVFKSRFRITEVCGVFCKFFYAMENIHNLESAHRILKSTFRFPSTYSVPKNYWGLLKIYFSGRSPKILEELCTFFAMNSFQVSEWLRLSLNSDLELLKNYFERVPKLQAKLRRRFMPRTDKRHFSGQNFDDFRAMWTLRRSKAG